MRSACFSDFLFTGVRSLCFSYKFIERLLNGDFLHFFLNLPTCKDLYSYLWNQVYPRVWTVTKMTSAPKLLWLFLLLQTILLRCLVLRLLFFLFQQLLQLPTPWDQHYLVLLYANKSVPPHCVHSLPSPIILQVSLFFFSLLQMFSSFAKPLKLTNCGQIFFHILFIHICWIFSYAFIFIIAWSILYDFQ